MIAECANRPPHNGKEVHMKRSEDAVTARKAVDITIGDLLACHDAGEDPRRTIARLNKRIVDYQRAGADLPSSFLHLSRRLTAEWIAQSQAR
jgi:hypothetical protein